MRVTNLSMKRFIPPILLGLIVLISACSDKKPTTPKELAESAVAKMDQLDFAGAKEDIAQIASIDSGSVWLSYANAAYDDHRLLNFDALGVYLQLFELNRYPQAGIGAARIFEDLGYPEEALEVLRKVAADSPDDIDVQIRLVRLFIANKLYEQADLAIKKVASVSEYKTHAAYLQALLNYDEYMFNEGDRLVDQNPLTPESPSELYELAAEVAYKSGLIDSAMSLSRLAWQGSKSPLFPAVTYMQRAADNGYLWDARQVMADLTARSDDSVLAACLKRIYFNSEHSVMKYGYGANLLLELVPDKLTTRVHEIQVTSRLGDTRSSSAEIIHLTNYVMQAPVNPMFQSFMAYYAQWVDRYSKDRVNTFNALKNIEGRYAEKRETQLGLAYAMITTGQFEEFDSTMNEFEMSHGDDPDWLVGMGDIFGDKKNHRWEKAEKVYRKALEIDQWRLDAFNGLLDIFDKQDKLKSAVALFDEYDWLTARYPVLRLRKSVLLARTGQLDDAGQLFSANFHFDRGNLSYLREISELCLRKKQSALSDQLFDLSIQLNGENVDALAMASEYFCDRGDYERALSLAVKAVDLEPDNFSARAFLARATYWTGKRDEALAMFEELFKENPDQPEINYYFARVLAHEKIDPARAENMARAVAGIGGGSWSKYQLNLAYVYYQGGKYRFARGAARNAWNRDQENPLTNYWVGMSMLKEGNPEGKKYLNKAIELGLSEENDKAARAALAEAG